MILRVSIDEVLFQANQKYCLKFIALCIWIIDKISVKHRVWIFSNVCSAMLALSLCLYDWIIIICILSMKANSYSNMCLGINLIFPKNCYTFKSETALSIFYYVLHDFFAFDQMSCCVSFLLFNLNKRLSWKLDFFYRY